MIRLSVPEIEGGTLSETEKEKEKKKEKDWSWSILVIGWFSPYLISHFTFDNWQWQDDIF